MHGCILQATSLLFLCRFLCLCFPLRHKGECPQAVENLPLLWETATG